MAVTAILKEARLSPRKVSQVAALIRGRSVDEAITILEHTPRRAALLVKQAVLSAKANAEHNHGLKPDSLFISRISIGSGQRFKRMRAAARGRALRYQHPTSHIEVSVDGEKRAVKKPPTETKPEAK